MYIVTFTLFPEPSMNERYHFHVLIASETSVSRVGSRLLQELARVATPALFLELLFHV